MMPDLDLDFMKQKTKKPKYKTLLAIDRKHKICTRSELSTKPVDFNWVKDCKYFLVVSLGDITRKVYTLPAILNYLEHSLDHAKYLEVEKFFMDNAT